MSAKEPIFRAVDKMVVDFLYYDRKGDEELPVGAIEKTLARDEISIGEIVDRFRNELHKGLAE